MGWFNENRSSRVGDQFGDLFGTSGQSPQYESDRFTRNSFQTPPISASDYNIGPDSRSDGLDEFRKIYANHPSMDAYRSALDDAPQAEDYRPNWATRIAAGLGGISAGMKDAGEGIKVAYGTNRLPYTTALADYKARIDPLESAAKIESSDRDDQLRYMYQARTLQQQHESTVRQHQNDLMDYNVAVRGLDESRRWHDATIGQGDKRLTQEANNYLSLDNYRKGGLANQRTGNRIAQGRLGVAQGELGLGQDRLEFDEYKQAHPVPRPVTPSSIGDAEANVQAEMSVTHPNLVVQDKTNPGRFLLAPPPNMIHDPAGYQRWKLDRAEYQRRVQQQMQGGYGDTSDGGGGSRYEVTGGEEEEQ